MEHEGRKGGLLLRNASLVLAEVRARGVGAHTGGTGWGPITKRTRSRGRRLRKPQGQCNL